MDPVSWWDSRGKCGGGKCGGGKWKDECGTQETCKTFDIDLEAILKAVGVENEGGHIG